MRQELFQVQRIPQYRDPSPAERDNGVKQSHDGIGATASAQGAVAPAPLASM